MRREPKADFVLPLPPNMIDAARANNSLPCYESHSEEIASNGQRQCRYKQFKETMPNGKSYAVLDIKDLPVDNTAPYTVPEGSVFLMGDNRDRSAASRVPLEEGGLGGGVPPKNLVGHAPVGIFPNDVSPRGFQERERGGEG